MASDRLSDSQGRRPPRPSISHKKGKSRGHSLIQTDDVVPFRYLNKNPTIQEWGPAGSASGRSTDPGEVKKQNLRAALLANSSSATHELGKRRSSFSSTADTAPGPCEEDVLSYVHRVQPTDTLARVLLLYDIDPGALRKANRLWPNDNIQMRSQLYLPVNDCAIKSTPLSLESTSKDTCLPANQNTLSHQAETSAGPSPGSPLKLQASDDHHSFVHIESLGQVEIVRMPRPKLSHFPPTTTDQASQSKPNAHDALLLQDPDFGSLVGEVAKESLEGLEVVGAAIETFVRRVAANARTSWMNKTTGDLIELTSQLGVRAHPAEERNSLRQKAPSRGRLPREENTLRSSASGSSLSSRTDKSDNSRTRRRTKNQTKSDP